MLAAVVGHTPGIFLRRNLGRCNTITGVVFVSPATLLTTLCFFDSRLRITISLFFFLGLPTAQQPPPPTSTRLGLPLPHPPLPAPRSSFDNACHFDSTLAADIARTMQL